MEVSHNVGIKNRYSCFLLYGEGEVEDVSVAEESVNAKKNKSSLGGVVNTKLSCQPAGPPLAKTAVKGKSQPQATKKTGSGSGPWVTAPLNSTVSDMVKGSTDVHHTKSSNEKYGNGKGKMKGEQNQNGQRYQRNRYDAPKTEEVVQEKDEVFFFDNQEKSEIGNSYEGVEIVGEDEEAIEEAKLMTLAEWKAMQQPREKPVYNLRKPGEGEDLSQWTKMVLKKDKEEEDTDTHAADPEDLEYAENEYPQRAARHKKIEINCLFVGLPREKGRGDGERDLRNKSRKNPNRRRFEENQSNRSAPKVDDINDFPSLG